MCVCVYASSAFSYLSKHSHSSLFLSARLLNFFSSSFLCWTYANIERKRSGVSARKKSHGKTLNLWMHKNCSFSRFLLFTLVYKRDEENLNDDDDEKFNCWEVNWWWEIRGRRNENFQFKVEQMWVKIWWNLIIF